ncbi:MAG: acyltransferase [Ruminococcus sp.]|uniref:acyltransferase family protein n=1 Tax=Ruminococcus sp. TaxID=41978 RepID=UPI0025DDE887|nr:acyltransferase [Ruminococcus sp.]MCR4795691.1 acyltransferase [Ruminococcus sp.]
MTEKNSRHLGSIDGLKGIGACIIAFFWHYQNFSPQNGSPFFSVFPVSYKYGSFMVELFFMLSGFGMMLGYSERIISRSISFREFIVKRLKRIYPPFLFFTLLTVILELAYYYRCGTTFKYGNFDIQHLIYNLLMMQEGFFGTEWSFNAPAWCISICMLCYLLFYLILCRVKKESHACYVFFAAALIGTALTISGAKYPLWNELVGIGVSCFFIGALLCVVYKNREKFRYQRLGYLCLGFIIMCYLVLRFKPEFMGDFRTVSITGAAPALILSVLFVPWLSLILGIRPLTYLGSLSIVIYLVHFPVQCAIKNIDEYAGLGLDYSTKAVWLSYAAAVLISAVLYKLAAANAVEKAVAGFFRKKDSKTKA